MLKNRNTRLLAIFFFLLAAFVISKVFDGKKERNFRDILVQVDTTTVTKVAILPKHNKKEAIVFEKEAGQWQVTQSNITDQAGQSSISGILSVLTSIKPARLVAIKEQQWEKYEVTDSLGTRIQVFQGEDLLSDFMIGKFNFQPTTRSASKFVRLTEEAEVYSVDGFLASSFNREFNDFRDKTFLKVKPEKLTSAKFQYSGDSAFTLLKNDNLWAVNDQIADSAVVANYLSALTNLTKSDFADDFTVASKSPVYSLVLEGEEMEPITVQAYLKAGAPETGYVLHTSQNADAYFNQGTLAIFDKLFIRQQSLFVQKEE